MLIMTECKHSVQLKSQVKFRYGSAKILTNPAIKKQFKQLHQLNQ